MRRLLRILLWPLRLLLIALVPCVVSGFLFVLYAESGSAVLMRALTEATQGGIRSEHIAGPLAGPLSLDGFVYEDQFVRVEVDGAELEWNPYALLLRTLSVYELRASRIFIAIKPQPPDPQQEDVLTSLPFALRVALAQVGQYEMDIKGTPLRFDAVQLSADWTGDTITVDKLQLQYEPVGTLDLTARLRMEPRQLRLLDVQLQAPAPLVLSGVIPYGGGFEADARWQQLQWPLQGEAQVASTGGTLSAQGDWDDYRFALDGTFDAVGIPFTLKAKGQGSTSALQNVQVEAGVLKGQVRAQGEIVWLPELRMSARGEAQGIDPAALWPEWPGRIGGSFNGTLHSGEGGLDAGFELGLRDSRLRDMPLALTTQGSYRNDVLTLGKTTLRSGGSRVQLQGRASAPYDLSATLDSPDLAHLLPQLRGRAHADLRFAGTPEQPQLKAKADAQGIGYGEFSVAGLKLDADLHPQRASSMRLVLQDISAGVHLPELLFEADGTAAANRLRLKARSEAGDVELGLRGALDLGARQWRGELVSGRGLPEQLPPWELEEAAMLRLSQSMLRLEPACWRSESGRACVQLTRNGDDVRVAFRLQDWAFAYFRSFLPPQWTLSGSASGTGLLVSGAAGLREARAELNTTAGRLSVGSQVAMAFEPSALNISEEADGLEVKLDVPLQGGGGVAVDAHLDPGAVIERRRLSGRLKLDFADLTPLRMLTPEIESIRGRLHGNFVLSGTAGRPRSDGRLSLEDGALDLAAAGIQLKELQAELRSRANSDTIALTASAKSGEGWLRVEGQTDPLADESMLKLHITGSDFQAVNVPQVHVWVSPDLRFELARNRADLRGEVLVPRAEILPRSFAQGIAPSRDQIILSEKGEAESAGLLKIYSNVRIVLGDNVKFDGFGLKSKLQGAINATDEPGRPTQGRGEIRLIEGRYQAYGQDLTIETGRLLFTGGLITDPAIELRAVRHPSEDITVGIHARGTLASPLFTLYSTPDMPQDQQLSWLVLGRGIEADASAGERNAVSDAALSLGMSGGSYLTQKLGAGLKLDEVSIGAKPGQTADQAQFTIGKYLSPKLYVSYGIGVFQPGHTFRLLYDIGRHFKLSTESGLESGGDLLYSIERD